VKYNDLQIAFSMDLAILIKSLKNGSRKMWICGFLLVVFQLAEKGRGLIC